MSASKKPDRETLRNLYHDEGLTLGGVAKRIGVTYGTMLRWMKDYEIPRRTSGESLSIAAKRNLPLSEDQARDLYENRRLSIEAIGRRSGLTYWRARECLLAHGIQLRHQSNGLRHHGGELPTKEDLVQHVQVEHIPLSEVAAMYGITGCSLARYLDKYDIPRPKARDTRYRGNAPEPPTESELRQLVEDKVPLEEIAERFGVYRGLISRLCDKHGITKRPGGVVDNYYVCADGHVVKSRFEQRVDDWLHEHGVPHDYEPKLEFNRRFKADFLANNWHIEVWGMGKRSKSYMDRRYRKTVYYITHGLPLIQLEPQDFNAERDTWIRKLKACLQLPPACSLLPLKFDPE